MQDARVGVPARRNPALAATVEICAVVLLVAAGTISIRASQYAVAIAILFWPVRWLATGRLSVRTAGDWPVGALLLMLPLTAWATALPDVTWPAVWRLALGVCLYYAIANWARSTGRLRILGLGLAGLGLLLAGSAPVTVQWFGAVKLPVIPEAIYRQLPVLLADPIHPNIMAGSLAILLPVALGMLLFDWRGLRCGERAFLGLASLLMAAVLVLTKSRGGMLGCAAAMVVLVALRWRWGWLAIPGAAGAAALVTWRVGLDRVLAALSAAQAVDGLDGRLEVWSRAIFMTQDFPFTGIGMGTFRQVANAMYPFFLAGPDADIPHAHNLFLQVAVDLGLPGLVAWLALFGIACLAAWRVYRGGRHAGGKRHPEWSRFPQERAESKDASCPQAEMYSAQDAAPSPANRHQAEVRGFLAALGAGLLASQVALAVHGLLDAATWGTRPAVVVWAVWGLAMAACNRQAACQESRADLPVDLGANAQMQYDTGGPEESWS